MVKVIDQSSRSQETAQEENIFGYACTLRDERKARLAEKKTWLGNCY